MAASPFEGGTCGLEEMCGMLRTILDTTENSERRQVEAAVARALETPSNLMLLVRVVQNTTGVSAGVRQLAAVLLQKKTVLLWNSISMGMRAELKCVLLAQLGLEPVRVVRFALAHLVSRLAKAVALQSGETWPELVQAISAAVGDPRVDVRELAMVLVYSLADVLWECGFTSASITEAVLQGMADADITVQRAAVKAMGGALQFLFDSDAECVARVAGKKQKQGQILRRVVSRCLELLAVCGALGEKTALCVDVLDLLEQFVCGLSVKKHAEILRTLAFETLSVLVDKRNQPRVRENSSELLLTLVKEKPRFVTDVLVEPMVSACLQVMSEDGTISLPEVAQVEKETNDDDFCNDDDADMLHVNPPCMYAGRLLSTMATNLSAKLFTAALLPFISRVSENTCTDPFERKAVIISLACLAEGNPGYLRRRVRYVLKLTQDFLNDSSPVLREAAAFSLAYFCTNLQPEILMHHQQLFSMLVPLLADDVDEVRRRVANALDSLCENVAEDVEPYVSLVLQAVLEAIARSSVETQKELCGVISSLATTRSQLFKAHGAHCLELLKTPFLMNSQETVLLRAKATGTVGIVANAIGKEAFMPFMPFFIQKIAENFGTRQAELREESFGFMSNLCEMLRAEFVPYLDDSLGYALQTINEDRAVYTNKHLLAEGNMRNVNIKNDDLTCKDSDKEESEETQTESDAEEIHIRVRTADVEEKTSAVYFIGVCADVLLGYLGPSWTNACWAALNDLDVCLHDNIRCEILKTLAKLTKAAHGSADVVKSSSENTLTPDTRNLLDTLVNDRLLLCFDDTNKEVVAAACDAFALLLDFFGPQTFGGDTELFVQAAIELLEQRTPCQCLSDDDEYDDDYDEGDDDEGNNNNNHNNSNSNDAVMGGKTITLGEDHDAVLMDAVCDMIESFAKAYGPAFKAYSDSFLPLLLRYTNDDRPSEDLVMATGCIATIMEAMEFAAESYVDHAINLALHLIKNTDESSVKANCAYLIRVLVENFSARFDDASTAGVLLQVLSNVACCEEEIPAAVDNAVSALCSMVRCLSPAVVPLQFVVQPLLEKIPMRVDRTENANAVRTIVHLLTVQQDFVLSSPTVIATLVRCVANVLAALTVDEEHKQLLVVQGVGRFRAATCGAWAEACGPLPPELRAALERYGCCS